jgi:hypothetical protein
VKKVVALVVLVLVIFVVYNRNRLYVRDPLGSMTRDGVKQDGAQIFINFQNEVLIENDNAPAYLLLVQQGQIGTPKSLSCMHWIACLADADVATLIDPSSAKPDAMSNKTVNFRGSDGVQAVVKIR